MSAPEYANNLDIEIYQRYYSDLEQSGKSIKGFDFDNILKIQKFFKRTGMLTKKQYRAFRHYCRVYKIDIPNSLGYIVDD
jgi:hypothetical protein